MNAPIDADDFPTVNLIVTDIDSAVTDYQQQHNQASVGAADRGIDTRSTASELRRGLLVLRDLIRSLAEVRLTHWFCRF